MQSVLNQTFQDFEVIYLDDASTDNSEEVFSKFKNDPRIRAIRNKSNSGSPFHQWNKGAKEACGEYLWFAEADDYCEETLLETLVAELDKSPKVGIAFCESHVVDESDGANGKASQWAHVREGDRWQSGFRMNGLEACHDFLLWRNVISNASAVLLRKSNFNQVGGADDTMCVAGDWMLWSKMLLVSDLAFIAEPLNFYRYHQHSASHAPKNLWRLLEERHRVARVLIEGLSLPPNESNAILTSLCDHWAAAIWNHTRAFSFKQNRAIYCAASAIDPRLKLRLIKTLVSLGLRKNQFGTRVLNALKGLRVGGSPHTNDTAKPSENLHAR